MSIRLGALHRLWLWDHHARTAGQQPSHRLGVVTVAAGYVTGAHHGRLGEVLAEYQHLELKGDELGLVYLFIVDIIALDNNHA